MWISDKWKDFEVIDTGSGEKLERWGDILLARPDPQVIWEGRFRPDLWEKADARYHRSNEGGGGWKYKNKLPASWTVCYGNLKFGIKPMGFKHTGLFPEQATNWDYVAEKIKKSGRKDIKVLNLFAYTGGATVAAAAAGAEEVVHVDSSKGMVTWAKENAELSGLGDKYIRFIVDDVLKFVAREKRRGRKYDIIIMDPPSYGRGPGGELWKLEDCVDSLISLAASLLTDKPLFFLVNSYTAGLSPSSMGYMLDYELTRKYGGKVVSDEIGLSVTSTGGVLPCGGAARWSAE